MPDPATFLPDSKVNVTASLPNLESLYKYYLMEVFYFTTCARLNKCRYSYNYTIFKSTPTVFIYVYFINVTVSTGYLILYKSENKILKYLYFDYAR